MNLEELEQVEIKETLKLDFGESKILINKSFKALTLQYPRLTYGCSKCEYGKIKTAIETYPGYETKDCRCKKITSNINKFLGNCKFLDKNEILKFNFSEYIEDTIKLELLFKMSQDNNNYFFFGTPGNGKTYATFIILYFSALTKTVYFGTLQLILEDAMPNSHNENQGSLFRYSLEVGVLVLDDFGREKMSEWSQNKLFSLLDTRNKRNLKTLFTSNYDYGDIQALEDPAVFSRVRSNCLKVKVTGEDKRLIK